MKHINTGIDPNDWKKPAHDKKDYYLGAVAKTILFKDGHGQEKYLPKPEFQKKKLETMMCVSASGNNCEETLGNFYDLSSLFKVDFDISDRGLAEMSGTTKSGNSPNKVCETRRTKGFLWEFQYPYPEAITTWEEFYANLSAQMFTLAAKNRDLLDYTHEWVKMIPSVMINALHFSSIQGIGFSWIYDHERGVYIDGGNQPNHAFQIFDYVYGKYWLAYDTYDDDFLYNDNARKEDFIKKLDWNFAFGDYGKLIFTKPKVNAINTSLLLKLKIMFKNLKAYMDSHGLHIWYIDSRGKQEIPLTTMAEKALFMSYVKEGIIPTTTFPKIAGLPNFKFF